MNQKTFRQALIDINERPESIKKCLQDKRLTLVEKGILESYLLIRNNNNTEAYLLLKGLAPSPLPFVEAQKYLISGIALNNQSLFLEAESYLQFALKAFNQIDEKYFIFASYFNLSFVYMNTRNVSVLKDVIRSMEDYCDHSPLQKLRVLRVKFNFYVETQEQEKALEILTQIKKMAPLPESDAISLLLGVFSYHITNEDYQECYKVLEEMKNYRKYHLTENFNYMKKMLDHLIQNTPIYISSLKTDSIPFLHYQLSIIHYLEERDISNAKKSWDELAKISPSLYRDNFIYLGDKCLFSLCLNKNIFNEINTKDMEKKDVSHLNLLIDIMMRSEGPIHKSLLYECIWGEVPVDKEDLKRLSRLISRMRTEKGIEIVSRKGTYFIDKKVVEKKKA